MQDHPLDHSGAVAPASVEHLDLVTAELRRRIAGIGLAIAELREETGRLRASADDRYHAVAVLDRPLCGDGAEDGASDECAPQPVVIESTIAAPEAAVPHVRVEPGLAGPVSPWRDDPIAVVDPSPVARPDPAPAPILAGDASVAERVEVVVAAQPTVVEPVLIWVPEPGPVVAVAPAEPPAAVVPEPASLWSDGDHDDAAAFEAFFSAEIEPEPSQRWLLSD